jgi:hypothetical protein
MCEKQGSRQRDEAGTERRGKGPRSSTMTPMEMDQAYVREAGQSSTRRGRDGAEREGSEVVSPADLG